MPSDDLWNTKVYPPGSKSEALQLGVNLISLIFYYDLTIECEDNFPPGSKSEALQLEVHLISLIFY